jgi:probable phosphoglycerate mutase
MPLVEDGLREIAYGRWEGAREHDVSAAEPALFDAWHADPSLNSPPGGETAFDIAARALPVIHRVRERHDAGHVVLVSHKATIRVIVCCLLGVPLQRFRTHIACPTASISSFEVGLESTLLVRLADVHHLTG